MDQSRKVWIALGANLGDRFANIAGGLAYLVARGVELADCSGLYETAPVGYVEQPDFYNMVALINASLEPLELLGLCKQAEKVFLREKTFINGPRTLDIDILFFGDLVMDTPELTIPHPRIGQRAFVLGPLEDIGRDEIIRRGYSFNREGIKLVIPAREVKERVQLLANACYDKSR